MQAKISQTRLWVHEPEGQEAAARALMSVLHSGDFILGKQGQTFEKEFCDFLGVAAGVGVGSGTDAITLALLAGGIQPGDEVLVPDFAPGATASAVVAAGATPVLVDVNEELGLHIDKADSAVTAHTKAVVVVHLFGRMDDMDRILSLARKHNLWVVEDCAHAHGAKYWDTASARWQMAGTMGHVGAFSFYPTKNLGGIGDAGFCCSNSPQVVDTIRELRQYGWKERDNSVRPGRNSRMDEVQAAILRTALPQLERWNARRRDLADFYIQNLAPIIANEGVTLPFPEASRLHIFHQFVIRTPMREHSTRALADHGVGYGIHYPKALSQQPAYSRFGGTNSFSTAQQAASEVLSLPMHPWLSHEAACRVAEVLHKTWRNK
jgi:dTDP-4-amino-4,6-dideoxygalactose transaminase